MLEEGHHSNRTASGDHMELDLFRLKGLFTSTRNSLCS